MAKNTLNLLDFLFLLYCCGIFDVSEIELKGNINDRLDRWHFFFTPACLKQSWWFQLLTGPLQNSTTAGENNTFLTHKSGPAAEQHFWCAGQQPKMFNIWIKPSK